MNEIFFCVGAVDEIFEGHLKGGLLKAVYGNENKLLTNQTKMHQLKSVNQTTN